MKRLLLGFFFFSCISLVIGFLLKACSKYRLKKAYDVAPTLKRNKRVYEKFFKRGIDILGASMGIFVLAPIYLMVGILVRINLGSPIIFKQSRPGQVDDKGREQIFEMYKFRTMTDERDCEGKLLSDEKRLTRFGAWLRSTSLDELPELFNILEGTMSIVGPRPQLVRDMVFMTQAQRYRHTAKPGLTGLAQINGRNAISWNDKLSWDLKYIQNISLIEDLRIIFKTLEKAFIQREGITDGTLATALDYGDELLRDGKISAAEYQYGHILARRILK